ncbi:LPS export ABC transporter permease LptF [Thiobacter aerophilum]|uniref:Lipopolysaccharide export system permease protein LptF n=1 Tax=Thiobacter aerophilum TaxID=3121275 RepID=A0ABV0EKW8_9BURK
MLYRRAFVNELLTNALAVFAVLVGIFVTTLWIRFLGRAASGVMPPEAVLVILGFSIVNYLPVLLSVTLFVAALLTLTRMARDHELVVWQSVGLGATAWIKPLLMVTLPVTLVIAAISLGLGPWAVQKSAEYRSQVESREEVSTIAPGLFRESKAADRVYFVESLGLAGDTVRNVFVRSEQHGRLGIIVAGEGRQWVAPNGDRFLIMENGRRYEGVAGRLDYRILQFQRYLLRVEPFEARMVEPSIKAIPSWVLLLNPTPEGQGELQWRAALPITAVLLALLAIPMSYVNPRSGRSFHLVAAVFAYMIYSNLLSVAQAWVAQGKLSPWVGLWSVHLVMALVVSFLFYRCLSVVPLLAGRRP